MLMLGVSGMRRVMMTASSSVECLGMWSLWERPGAGRLFRVTSLLDRSACRHPHVRVEMRRFSSHSIDQKSQLQSGRTLFNPPETSSRMRPSSNPLQQAILLVEKAQLQGMPSQSLCKPFLEVLSIHFHLIDAELLPIIQKFLATLDEDHLLMLAPENYFPLIQLSAKIFACTRSSQEPPQRARLAFIYKELHLFELSLRLQELWLTTLVNFNDTDALADFTALASLSKNDEISVTPHLTELTKSLILRTNCWTLDTLSRLLASLSDLRIQFPDGPAKRHLIDHLRLHSQHGGTPKQIASILDSMARLAFDDTDLFDYLFPVLTANLPCVSPSEYYTSMLAVAELGFKPRVVLHHKLAQFFATNLLKFSELESHQLLQCFERLGVQLPAQFLRSHRLSLAPKDLQSLPLLLQHLSKWKAPVFGLPQPMVIQIIHVLDHHGKSLANINPADYCPPFEHIQSLLKRMVPEFNSRTPYLVASIVLDVYTVLITFEAANQLVSNQSVLGTLIHNKLLPPLQTLLGKLFESLSVKQLFPLIHGIRGASSFLPSSVFSQNDQALCHQLDRVSLGQAIDLSRALIDIGYRPSSGYQTIFGEILFRHQFQFTDSSAMVSTLLDTLSKCHIAVSPAVSDVLRHSLTSLLERFSLSELYKLLSILHSHGSFDAADPPHRFLRVICGYLLSRGSQIDYDLGCRFLRYFSEFSSAIFRPAMTSTSITTKPLRDCLSYICELIFSARPSTSLEEVVQMLCSLQRLHIDPPSSWLAAQLTALSPSFPNDGTSLSLDHAIAHLSLQLSESLSHYCKLCDMSINGDFAWNSHIEGRLHAQQNSGLSIAPPSSSVMTGSILTTIPLSPHHGPDSLASSRICMMNTASEYLSEFRKQLADNPSIDLHQLFFFLSRIGSLSSSLPPTPSSDRNFYQLLNSIHATLKEDQPNLRLADLTLAIRSLSECARYNLRLSRNESFTELWNRLFDKAARDYPLDTRTFCAIIGCAGKIGQSIDSTSLDRLIDQMTAKIDLLSPQESARSLWALAKLAPPRISPALRTFSDQLIRLTLPYISSLSTQDITNTIWAVGKLQTQLTEIGISALYPHLDGLSNEDEVVNALIGLSELKASLPENLSRHFSSLLTQNPAVFSANSKKSIAEALKRLESSTKLNPPRE